MKRKLVALFLISAMVLLAACGSSKGEEPAPGGEGADAAEEAEEVGTIEPEMEAPEEGPEEGSEGDLGEADETELEPLEEMEAIEILPPSGSYPDYPKEGVAKTTEGEPHPDNSIWFSDGAGLSIEAPKAYLDNTDKMYIYYDGGEADLGIYEFYAYLYPASHGEIVTMDAETFGPIDELAFNLVTIYRAAPNWTVDQLKSVIAMVEGINDAPIEEVGKDGDYTLYAYVAEGYPDEVSDNLKPIYDEILSQVKESSRNITLYQPADYSSMNAGSSLIAEAKTVEGDSINTGEIFSNNKITMVNCWASWCGPCIQEMPELEKLSKELEEMDCQLIGVLMDGDNSQGLSDGRDVIEDTGVTYPNLIAWEGFNEEVTIQAYPTTFFVNQNGEIVGKAIIGAYPENYMAAVKELLSE